jgi:hypothetical protein
VSESPIDLREIADLAILELESDAERRAEGVLFQARILIAPFDGSLEAAPRHGAETSEGGVRCPQTLGFP